MRAAATSRGCSIRSTARCNYVRGFPRWCFSIACCDPEGSIVGVTFDPLRDELFLAIRGRGATRQGTAIQTSNVSSLHEAVIGTGFAYDNRVRETQANELVGIARRVGDVRQTGSSCLDLADVASGRIDGFYESLPTPWDRVSGMLLVQEAGGVISVDSGSAVEDLVVAAGPALFSSLKSLLR